MSELEQAIYDLSLEDLLDFIQEFTKKSNKETDIMLQFKQGVVASADSIESMEALYPEMMRQAELLNNLAILGDAIQTVIQRRANEIGIL